MSGVATFLRDLHGFTGDARLYRCSPPMTTNNGEKTEHVVVSGCHAMFSGPETYIFPADSTGSITDWGELDGSFQGAIDHERALSDAGYTVQT